MQPVTSERSAMRDEGGSDIAMVTPSQSGEEAGCSSCSGSASIPLSHVYAIGRIEARFPRLSVEKEFTQATGRAQTAGQTDQQAFHTVLSKPESRYLARQLCWVLTVQGLETYLVQPGDPRDFDRLVEAIRPQPSPLDIDVVIGMRGPVASPDFCNGLMLPIVVFDQIYSFDRDTFVKAIPRPGMMTDD